MGNRQEIQKAYEENGWHFDDTGGQVVVGWKNVTLKDGKPGSVTVSSDAIVIHGKPCANYDEFAEMIFEEKHVVKTFNLDLEDDGEPISLFLHDTLEYNSANSICESLDGIRRYELVT